ncbi:lytic murein transglycosylase [Micromonospora sp. NPDC048830]|uniref:lytic murein transglycosylase n=1 Tax=Micromonospora sp. NPDC048830 TaxID=3364257 RepID=UPI00370FD05C
MVDGEESATDRPLRPAAPPEEPGGGPAHDRLPRPRRPWLRSEQPTETPAPAGGPDAADAAAKPEKPGDAAVKVKADGVEGTTADETGGVKADAAEGAKADATGDAKAEEAEGVKGDEAGDAGTDGVDGGESAGGRRRRVPFAHAVRMPPPRQAVAAAARATRAWSRRPAGRLTMSGLFLLALVGATAAAGALVVPATAPKPRPAAVDATGTPGGALPGISGAPAPTGLPGFPGATATPGGLPGVPAATGRPADALAAWAQQTGAKVGISPIAMQAYGYAELVLAETNRSCQLSWTTLAAIGYVESRHGQANGATLGPDARALPEIIGDPLDGKGGRSLIRDTDRGLHDRDTTYDRAIGPMQFIPTTWQEIGADADNDGRKDPHDLDDAALAAGNYLCKGGRNMTIPGDWWGAILSYNDVRRYAQDVFDKANEYGVASRRT